jgi:hypothetical protein
LIVFHLIHQPVPVFGGNSESDMAGQECAPKFLIHLHGMEFDGPPSSSDEAKPDFILFCTCIWVLLWHPCATINLQIRENPIQAISNAEQWLDFGHSQRAPN